MQMRAVCRRTLLVIMGQMMEHWRHCLHWWEKGWKFPSLGLWKTRTLLPAHIVQLPTAGGLVIGMFETMYSWKVGCCIRPLVGNDRDNVHRGVVGDSRFHAADWHESVRRRKHPDMTDRRALKSAALIGNSRLPRTDFTAILPRFLR
jgi:hypothetical protein